MAKKPHSDAAAECRNLPIIAGHGDLVMFTDMNMIATLEIDLFGALFTVEGEPPGE